MMSSDAKSQDILPENNGVVLSDKESAFLKLQLRYHELLDIPANQRTEEEKKEANKLRRPYSEKKAYYPHLVEDRKRVPATDAERMAKSRQQRSDEARVDALAVDRKRKATPTAKEANKERMAAIRNMPIPSPAEILKRRRDWLDQVMEPGTWRWFGGGDNYGWQMKRGEDGKVPPRPRPDVAYHIEWNHKDFIYYPPDEQEKLWDNEQYQQYRRVR